MSKMVDFKDNCGFGVIADIKGNPTHEMVNDALTALERMMHRGAIAADGKSGDGSGLLFSLPKDFFRKKAKEFGIDLPEQFGVGVIFLKNEKHKQIIEEFCEKNDLKVLLWREVTVNTNALGELALKTMPKIYHVFIVPNSIIATKRFEELLYLTRKEIENAIDDKDFYIPTFSSKKVAYKGLLMPNHIKEFYPDLADKDFKVYLFALFKAFIPKKKIKNLVYLNVNPGTCRSERSGVINKFKEKDNSIFRGKIHRENLFINATLRQGNGYQQCLQFLNNHQKEQGIIYTLSRKKTEDLAEFLQKNGYKSRAYHAGLNKERRHRAFRDFVNDEIDIVVATIAFGMGIDKSNIRFVVHMSLPKTMEGYYQEMGRAGRDGLPSEVLLLHSSADVGVLGGFIADIEDEEYQEYIYHPILAMRGDNICNIYIYHIT